MLNMKIQIKIRLWKTNAKIWQKYNNNELLKLLLKFEELFDGTLGTWKTDPVHFKLKLDVKLICSRLYPVPKVHKEIFKKEVEILILLGLLILANDSEWGAPYFAQPKPKSNWVRFISDFRNLNKQLKHKTYPMPNINEILLKLECLQYVLLLDLNMGYYHILLSKNSSNLCMIILPRVKYSYKCLPMGISHSLEIFQHKMKDVFYWVWIYPWVHRWTFLY